MTNFKKTFAKGGIATAAVGAMALAVASPAQARDRDGDGISVGDVIAGAVIIGGIAAVANAASKDRDYDRGGRYYRDGRYYNDGRDYRRNAYRSRGNPRAAVEKCVRAAKQDARRSGYRFAQVTDIRDVKDTRYGWRVKGRIAVDGQRSYNRYDRYDRNDRYDRRDDRRHYGRYGREDEGRFSCYIERGRVTQVDFKGIRGLR